MEVLRPDDAPAFLRLAGRLLGRDEARNQLPLGIAGTLAEHRDAFDVVRFWVVRDGGEPVAAALRTEPYDLVLGDPDTEAALGVLLDAVVADDPASPGVVGNVPHVRRAAETMAAATGRDPEPVLSQGVYGLTSVVEVPRASGSARAAGAGDGGFLAGWLRAFLEEAVPDPETELARIERTVRTRLEADDAGFWLWEDRGEPVSLSGYGGPTATGIRVGPVYTPPEHRGRGYATTLVADQSRWLLQSGHRACFLFTDLTNPTSNRIYPRIGYERVCDSAVYRFRGGRTTARSAS